MVIVLIEFYSQVFSFVSPIYATDSNPLDKQNLAEHYALFYPSTFKVHFRQLLQIN